VRPFVCAHKNWEEGAFLVWKKTVNEAEIERKCAFCEFGTAITLSTGEEPDIICEKHGIVSRDHLCRSFRYDLLKREPVKKTSTAVDNDR
jgi:hypothetical protein